MNKKIFFSYLLTLGVCNFSLQAIQQPVMAEILDVDQDVVDDQDVVIATPVQILPLIAECTVDQNGDVMQIINVKHLGKKEIAELYHLFNQDDPQEDDLSLEHAANLVLSGSGKILIGTAFIIKGVCIGAIVGGKYIAPHVLDFTKEVWYSLSEKYAQYIAQDDEQSQREANKPVNIQNNQQAQNQPTKIRRFA